MNKDKKVLYVVSCMTFVALLILLLLPVQNNKIANACVLILLTVVTQLLVRKRTSYSISKREVLLVSIILSILYVALIELSGIKFGFYKNPYFANLNLILTTALPVAAIIVCSEIIRSTSLAQKNKFVSAVAFLSCLIADVLTFSNIAGITSLNRIMDLVGMVLFPAITSNLYYHYSARQFGPVPNIAFRLIMSLYVYCVPASTGMPDALLAAIKMLAPLLIYGFIQALFEKKKRRVAVRKSSALSTVSMVVSFVIIICVAMVVSCQFRFGAIVIATDSMTGEINKGDVIIYEQYKNQKIEEGQVIVFYQNNYRVIHRVVRIENVDNETRYYTKGDANNTIDIGYRTRSDIIGLTDIKIAYIGYPTLWLHELMETVNEGP